MKHTMQYYLEQLAQTDVSQTLQPIRRGIEKEALRVSPAGKLAQRPHPKELGSALTHPALTTDFSESLLEFITPVGTDMDKSLATLTDLHKFAMSHLPGEVLWPMSMPCHVEDEADIQVAQYGSSNLAQMKTLYRKGLHVRYGSMMQVIAGVHYNFSMPDAFWSEWQRIQGKTEMNEQEFRSESYMGLLRNYHRYAWLIPYLFGASPALCSSFLQGREHDLPFEKTGRGTLYLPYATSLRLSDLGYTNSSQSALYVCHNSLEGYVEGLQKAISTPSEQYYEMGLKDADGNYQQLNTNVLQIENELYSPIRPKRVAKPGETPTQALRRGGVEYIEIRSLDINPYSPIGIDKQTVAFMDLLLCFCLFEESELRDETDQKRARDNLMKVVLEGRKPDLKLMRRDGEMGLNEWGVSLIRQLEPIAKLLDQGQKTPVYQQSLQTQMRKLNHPNITPSGRMIEKLISSGEDNGKEGLKLGQQYRQLLEMLPYQSEQHEHWQQVAAQSLKEQREVEAADTQSFDDYLTEYFERNQQPFLVDSQAL